MLVQHESQNGKLTQVHGLIEQCLSRRLTTNVRLIENLSPYETTPLIRTQISQSIYEDTLDALEVTLVLVRGVFTILSLFEEGTDIIRSQ